MNYDKENKLDYLLNECREELSRHRNENEWDIISQKVCDDYDAKKDKPLFLLYIEKLETDGMIKKNITNYGYVVTYKGLF